MKIFLEYKKVLLSRKLPAIMKFTVIQLLYPQLQTFEILSLLAGKIFKAMNFEIAHFVRDDNQLFIYLGGVGWRLRRHPIPPKIIALKTPSFRVLTPHKNGAQC